MCEGRKRAGIGAVAGAVAIVALGLVPAMAAAQDTRAGEITAKQEEKAATSQPYKPSGYEKFMTGLESSFVSPPSGFFPFFGSVYSGGGFTLGPATGISTRAKRSGT